MAKTSRTKIWFIAFVIVGISVFFLMNLEFVEFPSVIPFTVYVENQGFNCKLWVSIDETDVNGKKTQYNPQTVFFKPQIPFDIFSSQTGSRLKTVDTDGFIQCTAVKGSTNSMNLVGGTVKTLWFVRDDTGMDVLIKTETKPLSTQSRTTIAPASVSLPTGTISASEIDGKITTKRQVITTKITAYMDFDLQFKSSITGNKIQTTKQSIVAVIPAKLQNTNFVSQIPISNVVRLTSVTPSNIDLKDYMGKTVSITVRGQLEQWKDTEGFPTVDIQRPDGSIYQKGVPMSVKRIISTSTNTYEFSLLSFNIPKTEKTGTWQVFMHSFNDVRKLNNKPAVDVKPFIIKDSTSITGTSGSSGSTTGTQTQTEQKTSNCNVDLGSNTNSCLPAKAFVAFTINFDGGSKSGTVPNVEVFDVSVLYKAALTGELKGQDKRVTEIQLRPQIDFSGVPDRIYVNNPQFKATYDILVNNETRIKDMLFNTRQIDTRTILTSSKFLQMMYISMNPLEITKQIPELQDGDFITFLVNIRGSADLTRNLDKYSIIVDGMNFRYDMINFADYNPTEPCQGLSGEEIIKCTGDNPPDDSGGNCAGLTHAECAALNNKDEADAIVQLTDYINNLISGGKTNEQNSGNPKGTSGTSGACKDLSTEDCFKLLINDKLAVPKIDPTLIIVLVVAFIGIIILIIAVMIKRNRR